MKNKILIPNIFLLLLPFFGYAQGLVKVSDPGLLGQFKRMVSSDWDDWKPDPTWHEVLGVPVWPKNVEGSAFWGLANRDYWKGPDRRPMKVSGPFSGHLAAAYIHQNMAKKEKDTVMVTMKKSLATNISMSGGDLDVPYKIYFKNKFNRLLQKAHAAFNGLHQKYPDQWEKMMDEPKETTKQLLEYFEVTEDRINTLHHSFMDRGERMIAYFKILKTLEKKVDFALAYCNVNVRQAKLPSPKDIRKIHKEDIYITENDKKAVRHILKTFDF